ncbi:unnamed protein product [Hymenolepis diminuta]|uniref:Uncharacterized protein n=1 Tax=Hymenolepis diminuta TaxID=6216 RepID=A0A3P6WDZ0_HYMDI|nr:unnamed protein product [Hymenolepis diminuta]
MNHCMIDTGNVVEKFAPSQRRCNTILWDNNFGEFVKLIFTVLHSGNTIIFVFGPVWKVPFIIYELDRDGRFLFVRKPSVISPNTPVPALKNTKLIIDRSSWGISTPKYYLVIGMTEHIYH